MHPTYEYHKILMYVYHTILLSYMAPTYILYVCHVSSLCFTCQHDVLIISRLTHNKPLQSLHTL